MTTLNLRVRHACGGSIHTTPLTLTPVRLGSGLIRLQGHRCDRRPIELVGLQWWGRAACDCYLIDDWPEHGGSRCPHGTLERVGRPLTLAELQGAAREGLRVGEVVTPIDLGDNCGTCGYAPERCGCQPTIDFTPPPQPCPATRGPQRCTLPTLHGGRHAWGTP